MPLQAHHVVVSPLHRSELERWWSTEQVKAAKRIWVTQDCESWWDRHFEISTEISNMQETLMREMYHPSQLFCAVWRDTKHRLNSLAHSWCRGWFGTLPACTCTLGPRKPWLLQWDAVLASSAWGQAQLALQEQYFVGSKIFIAQFWISSGPCCGPWQQPSLQLWITPTGQHLVMQWGSQNSVHPCAMHSITSTTICRKGSYPQVFCPQKSFSNTLTQFQQKLDPKQY